MLLQFSQSFGYSTLISTGRFYGAPQDPLAGFLKPLHLFNPPLTTGREYSDFGKMT